MRLKWTRDKMSKRTKQSLEELENMMSMEKSFKKYREALKAAEAPCVPYIGFYLKDLVFIEEGNPSKIGNRISVVKQRLLHDIILAIQRYQKFPYNFIAVPSIQQYFEAAPKFEEKMLFQLSMTCEPRGATRSDIQ